MTRISTCLTYSLRRPARGFTLIEVLVVTLIVSIMMGVAVIRLPSMSRSAELVDESERMLTLLTMASDEAVVSGTELGFDIKKNEYRFFALENETGKWRVYSTAPFGPRQLAEGIDVTIRIEGRSSKQDKDETNPTIMFLSSGETTPAEIRLAQYARTDVEKVISSDGVSGFKLEMLDEYLARSSADK